MKLVVLAILLGVVCSQVVVTNFGCKNLSSDGVKCNQCSNRFWKDDQGICQPVSDACNGYNKVTGTCTSCYDGFMLLEVICIPDSRPRDANCAKVTNGVCDRCSKGFYLLKGICEMIDPLCKTWDSIMLECKECYSGYSLVKKACVVSDVATMVGCSEFNGSVCVKCAPDYYMNMDVCIWTDPSCKTFNRTNGKCLTCFPGYAVTDGTCLVSSVDANCKTFKDGKCTECSKNFYFSPDNRCIQIDPFCKNFDIPTKTCTSCYSGFTLVSGVCTFNEETSSFDAGCKQFDNNGKCTACSKGYYFNSNNKCIQVDPNCKTFDFQNKVCTECYSGYKLDQGTCLKENIIDLTQKNCAEELVGVCVKCAERAYFDIDMKCIMVSDSCKTFNTFNGHCTSCYIGFALNDASGLCLPSDAAVCSKKDSNNVCTECLKGYYLDSNYRCQKIDANCQIFNFNTRVCDQCYKGYQIGQNKLSCNVSPIASSPNVENCVTYDASGEKCTKCYSRFYLKNNQCIEANVLCKTFDNTGACLTCYTGFTVKNKLCERI